MNRTSQCLLALLCLGLTGPPSPPIRKAAIKRTVITQGSGAAALIAPKAIIVPPKTNTYWFAATATSSDGLVSEYSKEVSLATTQKVVTVTLAWDASVCTNCTVTNYTAYQGAASGSYTNHVDVGTNLTARFTMPRRLDQVVTITSINSTNLQMSASLRGPWSLLGTTNWAGTNITGPRFWRGLGRSKSKPGQVFLKVTYQ